MAKRRTITLTDRPPVTIDEEQWPVIAVAKDDSYSGNDYSRHQQASAQGELDEYSIRVRQHDDGRAIVYAVFDAASAWTGNSSRSGGELCAKGTELAAAIRRVGEDSNIPDSVIRACIADLPAEELV